MISFDKAHLAAPLHCAPKKDVRYYLVGVLLEVTPTGDIHLVSTDGNCLFAGRVAAAEVQWTGEAQRGPWSLIIPRDTVAAALKECKGTVTLAALPDGRYTLGSQVFAPIDGKYPDWRRVSPSAQTLDTRGEKPAQFDPDLLVRCRDALKAWFKGGPRFTSYLHAHEAQCGVMTGEDSSGYCVVMPWRTDGAGVRPFSPSPAA